jgi:hypothetical protein
MKKQTTKLLALAAVFFVTLAATAQAMLWEHFRRSTNIEDRGGGTYYPDAPASVVPANLFDRNVIRLWRH